MISYEKVRESLRSTTLGLAIYHLVMLILGILGIVFLLSALFMFKNEFNQAIQDSGAPELQFLSIFVIASSVISLFMEALLTFLNFKNAKLLRNEQTPKPTAYYIGITYVSIGLIFGIYNSLTVEGANVIGLIIPISALAAYGYAIYKYSIYKGKDNQGSEDIFQ